MHYFETTGGHAGTAGGWPRLGSSQPAHRTRCCTITKQQAALFEAVGDGAAMLEPLETGVFTKILLE
ncbi:MAG: hypothetical protein LBD24_09320 [Spirochaetaceae bacterium]|nr:hypothetical protein [Spirochaetaceae bacterium]